MWLMRRKFRAGDHKSWVRMEVREGGQGREGHEDEVETCAGLSDGVICGARGNMKLILAVATFLFGEIVASEARRWNIR
jgi:hypothetical protein